MSLEGKVAIITGVSEGLGAAAVRTFCGLGMNVVGISRRQDPVAALAAQVAEAAGSFTFVQGDVSRKDAAQRLAGTCLAQFGRVDILINNAAVSGVPPFLNIEDVPEETLRQVIDINLHGAFFMCQEVLPIMKGQRDGVILNIASVNGVMGTARFAPYNTSKAALIHLGHSVATEGAAYNVRCNNIILGSIKSRMNELSEIAIARDAAGTDAEPTSEQLVAHTSRWMEPDEVAATLALLCRPEARLITGADIAIDQGITAGVMTTYAQKTAARRLFREQPAKK